ncbi:MAG: BlaI family penicillinase repressor [Arenicella sp.]|jgi:BlaI family penicillinase repressor
MKELTKAEEKVMRVLWQLEKGLARDVLNKFEEPKPSYTTISTVIRVLEKKGFIGHKAYGNTYEYFPLITEEKYSSFALNQVMDSYFGGSLKKLVSFFAKKEDISLNELDEIARVIEKSKEEKE